MERSATFSSKIGFVLAAAGSAVGVGNIWGFPTQAASHGGGAFLLVYFIMIFLLGYPMLVAELAIGRYGQSNPVDALQKITPQGMGRNIAICLGFAAVVTVSLIFSFYAIVSGWFIAFALEPFMRLLHASEWARWMATLGTSNQLFFTWLFIGLTAWVVNQGIEQGIEKWSRRLMPLLFVLLLGLSIYMLTQPGAFTGLSEYLIPRVDRVLQPDVLLGALGQTFFSLSLGAGVMMVYGAYLDKRAHIPSIALQVTLIDASIAFLAGLLVLPAMYVAQNAGVTIFAPDGSLLSADTLVLQVLPTLFQQMGVIQYLIAPLFFLLMFIAALTSSISMLEASVVLLSQKAKLQRSLSACTLAGGVGLCSTCIVLNFDVLFGRIVTLTTAYAQPLVSLGVTIYAGWLWQRYAKLKEFSSQDPDFEKSFFWRWWSPYVRFVCPILVLVVFWNTNR